MRLNKSWLMSFPVPLTLWKWKKWKVSLKALYCDVQYLKQCIESCTGIYRIILIDQMIVHIYMLLVYIQFKYAFNKMIK